MAQPQPERVPQTQPEPVPLAEGSHGAPSAALRAPRRPPRLAVVGPTASGKGGLAIELARRLPGEVLSVDSMKVYRGMDIASAKPSAAKRMGVPFHLTDLRDPCERMSAADFVEEALRVEAEVEARGHVPVYAGGTALYLKALTEGLFAGPARDPDLRARLVAEAEAGGEAGRRALHGRLAAGDPTTAARLHPNDVRRVVRALEVLELTRLPISQQQRQWARAPRPDRLLFGLAWEREALYRRIDERVERMMADGLVEEVRALLARPRGVGPEAAQALGVKELSAWIGAGESEPLAEVVQRIQRNSRRFAKRQLTFFAHFPDIVWLDPARGLDALAAEVCERYRLAAAGAAAGAAGLPSMG